MVVWWLLAAMVALAALLVLLVRERRRRDDDALLERRLDLALEAGGMTSWLWDARTDRMSWDGRGRAVLATDPPSEHRAWVAALEPDDGEAVSAALAERQRFQLVHRLGDRWLEVRGEPVLADDGEHLGAAGVVVDVTEPRLVTDALAASRAALEHILDAAPAFVGEAPPDEVPRRICEAAVDVFAADGSSLVALDDGVVRPVVSQPQALTPLLGPTIDIGDLPTIGARLGGQQPVVVHRRDAELGAEALMAALGMQTAVVVRLARGDASAALYLTLWWREETEPDVGRLAAVRRFGDQAALALAQARARVARDDVDELNATLQAGLLPAPNVRRPGLHVAVRYRPSEERILLSGDFYDVLERRDGRVAFVLGDVTGHGPTPAAIGTALRAAWRAVALGEDDPAAWLTALGDVLRSYDLGPELLVTAFTGIVDHDGRVVVGNAGHPPPVVLSPAGAALLEVPPGIALGLGDPGVGIVATPAPLAEGDRLLLYTDGATDVRLGRRSTDRWGEDGLVAWLGEHRRLGDDALLDALLDEVARLSVGPLADDVALVLLRPR